MQKTWEIILPLSLHYVLFKSITKLSSTIPLQTGSMLLFPRWSPDSRPCQSLFFSTGQQMCQLSKCRSSWVSVIILAQLTFAVLQGQGTEGSLSSLYCDLNIGLVLLFIDLLSIKMFCMVFHSKKQLWKYTASLWLIKTNNKTTYFTNWCSTLHQKCMVRYNTNCKCQVILLATCKV